MAKTKNQLSVVSDSPWASSPRLVPHGLSYVVRQVPAAPQVWRPRPRSGDCKGRFSSLPLPPSWRSSPFSVPLPPYCFLWLRSQSIQDLAQGSDPPPALSQHGDGRCDRGRVLGCVLVVVRSPAQRRVRGRANTSPHAESGQASSVLGRLSAPVYREHRRCKRFH